MENTACLGSLRTHRVHSTNNTAVYSLQDQKARRIGLGSAPGGWSVHKRHIFPSELSDLLRSGVKQIKINLTVVGEPLSDNFYLSSVTVNPLWISGEPATIDLSSRTLERPHSENGRIQGDAILEKAHKEFKSPQEDKIEEEAWTLLRQAVVNYCGEPVGTVAANDPGDSSPLNYDQVFVRDFVPSALAFLLKGEFDIVRNFLLHTLQLQSWEKTVDCYSPGRGLMPASFKVKTVCIEGSDEGATEEVLDPDFGEAAIGRVAPVDSGLWWIILLRAYSKHTGDYALQERVDVQTGIKLILKLCLTDGFDMFPTLLVTDGSCMIDRRMGIHGHPLEIQSLFYSALRCAREMLLPDDGPTDLARAVNSRLSALSYHVREHYWVDLRKLNEIYRYKTEEYSHDAVNKFNIYPEQIPLWLIDWMPSQGGYMIGNLQPAHMDFRFFSLGNLWAIIGSLATEDQSEGILNFIEEKWDDLIGTMPLKIAFPALEYDEWRIITGSDPKNTPWSYHNGGSWPTLLWQFTVACLKVGRSDLARKALKVAEKRLSKDKWPEYYDTRSGRFIGKQARLYQTWSIAGYLVAKMLLENPDAAKILTFGEDLALLEAMSCPLDSNPRKKRNRKVQSS
ncbi:hypothetical protein GOP47_0023621 [Adiantum capillus-veneris]|uniref:Alkaline/neutral invertase n=1 Tax=Adiantum capillus-veneris TaxID=13818 RepID=A0A9D4U3U5_ADICA|nr:hypothetical protein GOP47_0023621 [Adiantum capillus-veneris]